MKSSKAAIIIAILATAVALVFSIILIRQLNSMNEENSIVLEKINNLDEDSLDALIANLNKSNNIETEEEIEYETYSAEEYAALKHAENSYF